MIKAIADSGGVHHIETRRRHTGDGRMCWDPFMGTGTWYGLAAHKCDERCAHRPPSGYVWACFVLDLLLVFAQQHVTRGRQVLYLYCCDLAPTVESFAVWRPRIEVSDLQHDGNHEIKCKAIRICATESGKGNQEAG